MTFALKNDARIPPDSAMRRQRGHQSYSYTLQRHETECNHTSFPASYGSAHTIRAYGSVIEDANNKMRTTHDLLNLAIKVQQTKIALKTTRTAVRAGRRAIVEQADEPYCEDEYSWAQRRR